MKHILLKSSLLFVVSGLVALKAGDGFSLLQQDPADLMKVFEIVIAGIIGSAIILSILALFLGQWSGRKQVSLINKLRGEAEQDKADIKKIINDVQNNAQVAQQLVNSLQKKEVAITNKQHQAWVHVEDIEEMVEEAEECNSELKTTTDQVTQRMDQIQGYWDGQLRDTTKKVTQVHSTLDDGLKKVESGLADLEEKETQSQQLSEKINAAYSQQNKTVEKNAVLAGEIKSNLDKASEESIQLLEQLETKKETATQSFQHFNSQLQHFESQAYEQCHHIIQSSDMARQELSANVNESRQHVENIRRYEIEGRNIKQQAQQHLNSLTSHSIDQFSSTLESTQQMFMTLQNDVQDAQYAIDSLRKMKQEIQESSPEKSNTQEEPKQIASGNVNLLENKQEENPTEEKELFKVASGDNTIS
ncbi:MAG: hypothetical protein KAG28_06220, partial [Cocleimonas sp.]|nr:hypothetical protein [Cocleimonas sp.]